MVFDMYLQNKYAYKLCIIRMKNDSEHVISNDLHDALVEKDKASFWKIWNSKFNIEKRNKPLTVNNLTNPLAIAEAFPTILAAFVNQILMHLKWFAGLFYCLRIFINSLQVFPIP